MTESHPQTRPGLLLPIYFLLSGGVLLGVGMGLSSSWIEVVGSTPLRSFLVLGGGVLIALGGRALVRIARGTVPSYEALRANRRRVGLRMLPVLLLGSGLLVMLIGDPWIAGVDVRRGAWFFWVLAVVCLALSAGMMWDPEPTLRRMRLQEGKGVAGRAVIEDFEDTGTTINDHPRVRLDLTVTIPGREPYPARVTQTVPRLSIGRLLKGESLPVLADPEAPEHIRILWKDP
jgi:hypothetical protein